MNSHYQEMLKGVLPWMKGWTHLGVTSEVVNSLKTISGLALTSEQELYSQELGQLRRLQVVSLFSIGGSLIFLFVCCVTLLVYDNRDAALVSGIFSIIMDVVTGLVFRQLEVQRRAVERRLLGIRHLFSLAALIGLCSQMKGESHRDAAFGMLISDLSAAVSSDDKGQS